KPQSFLPTSEIKCLHFHGTEVRKPIPSYQVYKGNLFDLVDQAVDFVMSKINRTVGTRAQGPQAPVTYELPKDAVAEAIVNAVAHRDYASNASAQVMLFADRLEVWNPGELPSRLTVEMLRRAHTSIPRNPLIAEPLFLARYIERAGTGTVDMISLCREAGLPEPQYRQDGGQFVQTLWRDWLTQARMGEMNLNERQRSAIAHIRQYGRISTGEYMKLAGVAERTALRDFEELASKGVIRKVGRTGRATHYVLQGQTRHKPAKPATQSSRAKRDTKKTKGTLRTRRKPAKPARRR
ncbi:MAG: DeoR family transcriptional regulator, partial [Elusimicrobia bacterium]|nr:DeoR family transcriptional regulator [Elusimicrobiota bacterium]